MLSAAWWSMPLACASLLVLTASSIALATTSPTLEYTGLFLFSADGRALIEQLQRAQAANASCHATLEQAVRAVRQVDEAEPPLSTFAALIVAVIVLLGSMNAHPVRHDVQAKREQAVQAHTHDLVQVAEVSTTTTSPPAVVHMSTTTTCNDDESERLSIMRNPSACLRPFEAWKRLRNEAVLEAHRVRAERAEAAAERLSREVALLTEQLHESIKQRLAATPDLSMIESIGVKSRQRVVAMSPAATTPIVLANDTRNTSTIEAAVPSQEGSSSSWTGLRLSLSKRAGSFPRSLECRFNGSRIAVRRAVGGPAGALRV